MAYYLVLTTGQVFDHIVLTAIRDGDEAAGARLWKIFDKEDREVWDAAPLGAATWIELDETHEWRLDREANILRYDGPHESDESDDDESDESDDDESDPRQERDRCIREADLCRQYAAEYKRDGLDGPARASLREADAWEEEAGKWADKIEISD